MPIIIRNLKFKRKTQTSYLKQRARVRYSLRFGFLLVLLIQFLIVFEGFKNLFKLNNTKGNQRLRLKQKNEREKKRMEAVEVEYY